MCEENRTVISRILRIHRIAIVIGPRIGTYVAIDIDHCPITSKSLGIGYFQRTRRNSLSPPYRKTIEKKKERDFIEQMYLFSLSDCLRPRFIRISGFSHLSQNADECCHIFLKGDDCYIF